MVLKTHFLAEALVNRSLSLFENQFLFVSKCLLAF